MSHTLSDLGLALKTPRTVRRGHRHGHARARPAQNGARRRSEERARDGTPSRVCYRLGGVYADKGRLADAIAVFREELALRETLIALAGRLAPRVRDLGWSTLQLTIVLLNLADAGGPEARAHANEARALFRTIQPDDIKSQGAATADPEFRAEYDKTAARLQASNTRTRE